MTNRNDAIFSNRLRGRFGMALSLALAVGCTPSLKSRLPWVSPAPDVGGQEPEGRIAGTKQPLIQTASFRERTPDDAALLMKESQALIESIDQTLASTPALPDPVFAVTPEATDPSLGESDENPMFAESSPQVIDLASALGMAGGNAWTIQLARQRTLEAHADLQRAQALWLPSLQFGVGWNTHEGPIQATPGQVIDTSRGSLFVGGGATLGEAPVAGGSGGPLRLMADLALADAFFVPKIASRQLSARRWGITVAKNQALLDTGLAYVDLLAASSQVADANAAIAAADELLKLTQTYADAGAGALADVDRAATAKSRLNQQLQNANRLRRTRSAALARRLRLDPRFQLHPADQMMVPLELSADNQDVDALISTALAQRPEINELAHEINGLCLAVRQADVDPWIPNVAVAASGGSFAGGRGSNLDNNGGRSDVDLQAVWEIESLGLGVVANRTRAKSRLAQRRVTLADLRDQISAQVVTAQEDVVQYRMQIETANESLRLAEMSYERNLQRVRADEGLPIELLQAIEARANGLRDRTSAVANYNRAQLRLLFATGQL